MTWLDFKMADTSERRAPCNTIPLKYHGHTGLSGHISGHNSKSSNCITVIIISTGFPRDGLAVWSRGRGGWWTVPHHALHGMFELWEAEGFDPSCRRAAVVVPAEVHSDFPVGKAVEGVAGADLLFWEGVPGARAPRALKAVSSPSAGAVYLDGASHLSCCGTFCPS